MKSLLSNSLIKIIFALVSLAVVMVAFSMNFAVLSKNMTASGISNCLLGDHRASPCPPAEHISEVQNILITTPSNQSIIFMLFIFVGMSIYIIVTLEAHADHTRKNKLIYRQRNYFYYLLTRGIFQPIR
jgi:hypothetical protein